MFSYQGNSQLVIQYWDLPQYQITVTSASKLIFLKSNYSSIILIKKSESKRISFKYVYFETVSVANRLHKKGSNICRQPAADFFFYLISLKNVFFVDSKRQLNISKTSIALVLLLLL